jgi:hypothetical protein
MTNQDTAIVAQMRAWLQDGKRRHIEAANSAPDKARMLEYVQRQEVFHAAIAHLDTLTSKRWRVIDIPDRFNHIEIKDKDGCTHMDIIVTDWDKFLIVTEEE